MAPILVVVGSTGRQGVPVIHSAVDAGFHVRAQVRSVSSSIAKSLASLPNVSLYEGSLTDESFPKTLFEGADYAWVNTNYYLEDEVAVGKALALAARDAGIKHYLYSTLADHSKITNGRWSVSAWAHKYRVEEYIRTLDTLPSTFVYVGSYFQNLNKETVLLRKRLEDGSILLSSKCSKDAIFPMVDVDRDLGPVVVNILKDGPEKWNEKKVAVAFQIITLSEIVEILSKAIGCKVTYEQSSTELDPTSMFDDMMRVFNEGVYFDWDANLPEEARKLNPNWHNLADFAKDNWVQP